MTLKPTLTIIAGLLAGLAVGSMESDSHACSLATPTNTWTLQVLEVSVDGDDAALLEAEAARWANASRLDFNPDDPTQAWLERVLFESDFGETLERIQFVQSDTSTQE